MYTHSFLNNVHQDGTLKVSKGFTDYRTLNCIVYGVGDEETDTTIM